MELLIFLLVLGIGLTAGYYFRRTIAKHDAKTAEAKVEKMISDAKDKYREIIIEAKNKSLEVLEKSKQEEDKRRRELFEIQRRLEKRESMFDQKFLEFEDRRAKLAEKEKGVETLREDLQKIKEKGLEKLEKIAALTKDEAKQVLINNIESTVKEELYNRVRKMERQTTEELEEKAKHILSSVIERCATTHSAETTTTTVNLPNDEMKGRIIGKEGRNIKTIEQLTGTELIVDETPGTIWVSGFSPIRRQVARVALEKLMADGRIHPGRIEEAIESAKKDLSIEIKKAGEDAMYAVGVGGLDPKLVQILGRLKYRTSYGHNVLQHSIEVSLLAGLLAQDLGADAISGARPGARKDTYEQYIQRLDDLEDTAKNIAGVEKVYAIQAGRELRVFVEPAVVDDWGAKKLAREVADKIEQDLKYPGEIKVTVIRETRVEEYAR